MTTESTIATPAWWMSGAHIGRVVSVDDPQRMARVRVTLPSLFGEGGAEIWARVAVPFAGDNRGAFLIPDVGDEVLVLFVGNNADAPVVVGALWNGSTEVPETLGGDRVDRWTIVGKAGTRIAIVEESSGSEMVEIETPTGVKVKLTEADGQSIRMDAAGNTIKMDTQGVSVDCVATCSVKASQVDVDAGLVNVNAGMSKFSGVVKCDTLIANSVVSTSYTPGAGNIW